LARRTLTLKSPGSKAAGGRTYKLTVPLPVPGKLFWSVTVYDAHTCSQIQTGQAKAVLKQPSTRPGNPETSNPRPSSVRSGDGR
jgi:hypothetical protein